MIIKEEFADIATPTGPMRLHLFRPAAAGRYPGGTATDMVDLTPPRHIPTLPNSAGSQACRQGLLRGMRTRSQGQG